MTAINKLEDSELWQLVSKIADQCYALLAELPDEEKWGMQNKLRGRAFDITSDVAEGIGAIDPRDSKWSLSMARRSAFGLKNVLRLAYKAGYIEPVPELMVQIDQAINGIDDELARATDAIPVWFREMDPPQKERVK